MTHKRYAELCRYVGTQVEVAEMMGISRFCLSRRWNNNEKFRKESELALLYLVSEKFNRTGVGPNKDNTKRRTPTCPESFLKPWPPGEYVESPEDTPPYPYDDEHPEPVPQSQDNWLD